MTVVHSPWLTTLRSHRCCGEEEGGEPGPLTTVIAWKLPSLSPRVTGSSCEGMATCKEQPPTGAWSHSLAVSFQPEPFAFFTTLTLRAMATVAKDTALTDTWQQVKAFLLLSELIQALRSASEVQRLCARNTKLQKEFSLPCGQRQQPKLKLPLCSPAIQGASMASAINIPPLSALMFTLHNAL